MRRCVGRPGLSALVTSNVDIAPLWIYDNFATVGNELPQSAFSLLGELSDRCWQLLCTDAKIITEFLQALAWNPYHYVQIRSLPLTEWFFLLP